jgi:hypothetical protein
MPPPLVVSAAVGVADDDGDEDASLDDEGEEDALRGAAMRVLRTLRTLRTEVEVVGTTARRGAAAHNVDIFVGREGRAA